MCENSKNGSLAGDFKWTFHYPLPNITTKIRGSHFRWISLSRLYADTSSRWRLSEFKIEKVPHHFVYPMFAMVFLPKCRRKSNAEWTSIRRIPYSHGFPSHHWIQTPPLDDDNGIARTHSVIPLHVSHVYKGCPSLKQNIHFITNDYLEPSTLYYNPITWVQR